MSKKLVVVLCTLVFCLPLAAPAAYVPGRGLHLGNERLILGGYLATSWELLDGERKQLLLEDLSGFLTYNFSPDLRLFSEFELEDALSLHDGGLDVGSQASSLERLYLEYEPMQSLRIRVGKLLTPIGIWNKIHAAPLVWTASRPLATERFFDTATTGIQIDSPLKYADLDLLATVFAQATNQLAENDRFSSGVDLQQKIHRGAGGRLQVGSEELWHAALSYLRFDDDVDQRWENVLGADFLFEPKDWEITSELSFNVPDGGATTWGMYLQAVYYLGRQLYPVLRYEHVETLDRSRNPLVFGVAWKPGPSTIFKLEGIVGRKGLDAGGNGAVASFAVLF